MSQALIDQLNARPTPDWFDEAKLGIFIHWGMYSIPSFAPKTQDIVEVLKNDFDEFQAQLPYVEWYWQSMRIEGSATRSYHNQTYGPDFPYEGFRDPFEASLENYDPQSWARQFKEAGAKYVVLVTKHHDGYCLWPTDTDNPHKPGWRSDRDLVGELCEAVRGEGMRFGVYYSGGFDWTFSDIDYVTPVDALAAMLTDKKYNAYVDAHYRELIDRYKPDVLWNDISYPGNWGIHELMSDYYETVPEGVVNDRWNPAGFGSKLARVQMLKPLWNAMGKRMLANRKEEVFVGPKPPHCDFRTPEFSTFPDIQDDKWEMTRGMGHGFAHNHTEEDSDMIAPETLVHDFVDAVSKNGNLLLNVGPDEKTEVPYIQQKRLKALGAFMGANGAAIYGSRPWTRAEGRTADGKEVRFTQTDGVLNAILLGAQDNASAVSFDLPEISGDVSVTLMDGKPVPAKRNGPSLELDLSDSPSNGLGVAVQIRT